MKTRCFLCLGTLDLINKSNFDSRITLISYPEKVSGIEVIKALNANYTTGFSYLDVLSK